MKKELCFLCLIILIGINSYGQQDINKLINDNLSNRYSNVEIVSITPDSCPEMRNLFYLSSSLKIVASECKLNIVKAFYQHSKNEISFDKTTELSQKEIDRIDALAKSWNKSFNSKSEKCLLVKYRYGNSAGIKTTLTDYYSLDENRYKEGNYPYLQKEFDSYYGFNYYEEVVNKYKELLLDIVNN
jgi:hypothetical protein